MSTNALKIIALILMVIDHIGVFIPNTPIFLNILGRASAPIFIFCTMLGFYYTHNRKIYLTRIYIFCVIMGFIDYFLNIMFKKPYTLTFNNIFSTLFITCLSIYLYENLKDKKFKNLKLFVFFILNILIMNLSNIIINITGSNLISTIIYGILPTMFTCEGSIIIVALGFVFYSYKSSKKSILKGYLIYCMLYFLLTLLINTPILNINTLPWSKYLFYENIQWLQIWALPFILTYNGKKGINMKYLFYIFYPTHIIILFILGNIMF